MKQIAAALVKAQKGFGPALKTSTNPHFRSRYADLSACVEAVVDSLNANGIVLLQPTQMCTDGVIVETVFLHESGEEWRSGPLHVPATKLDPQGYGSALTYARRYSLMTACGIAPEDDDGNASSPRREPERKAEPEPQPTAVKGAKESLQKCVTLAELREAWELLPPNLQHLCKATKDNQKARIESEALTGA